MIDLLIKAETENVAKIKVNPDHVFFIKLRCTNCHEEAPNAVGVSREMQVEGIRGASVNLQIKCKGCGRSHDISLDAEEGALPCWQDGGDDFQRICTFELRGMDPFEYEIRDGYTVVATDGSTFEDVDLSDDWMEVDQKGNPVSISAVEAKFSGAKKDNKKKKK